MDRARIYPKTKIDGLCDLDKTSRFRAVQIVPHDKSQCFAASTDGRGLSVALVDGQANGTCYLPGGFVRVGKKVQPALLNGEWRQKDRVASEPDVRFPRVASALRKPNEGAKLIRLDANLLAKVANAIDENGVVLLMIDEDAQLGGVLVCGDSGIGVVMPYGQPDEAAELAKGYERLADEFRQAVEPKPASR